MADDDLIIRVGPYETSNSPGRQSVFELRGWTSVRLQRSCEAFPSVFEIATTERYPGDNIDVPIRPGDPCQVYFTRGGGRDVAISGYIDAVTPSLSAERHSITIAGRGKAQDLVDCSAVWPTGQFNNASVLTIAQNLAQPFGIPVAQINGDEKIVPQLIIMWGETPYELIERVARFAGLLVYDGPDGSVVLSRVGSAQMASGIAEGANVIRASITYTMNERFSQYRVRRLTFSPFMDSGANPEGDLIATIVDGGVPRFRPRYIIAETPAGMGLDYAIQRGNWEASRRFGRSAAIRATVDSWRDGSGNLWAPNSSIMVDLPTLKIGASQKQTNWIISTVLFRRDERGTEADLLILPADAFDILPVPITPLLNAGPY